MTRFDAHLTSGNGTGRQEVVSRHPEKQEERARNLKFAMFYLAVGILLFLGDQFAKRTASRREPSPMRSRTSASICPSAISRSRLRLVVH